MEKRRYTENKTFRYGANFHLNACVGHNGYVDLYRYQCGYHDATVRLLDFSTSCNAEVDSLVYPIAYSARHSVELFLKNQLYQMYEIKSLLDGNGDFDPPKNTHSIKKLAEEFLKLSRIDKRYNSYVSQLDGYFKDYAEIDDSGETFRYPFDHEDSRHLTNLFCVNLGELGARYLEMYVIIDEIDSLTEYLLSEYRIGSFIRDLSRQEIREIAQRLPNRQEWSSEAFRSIKDKILAEYDISSKTFSEVLDFIQAHYEFASMIGIEVPIEGITIKDLKAFTSISSNFDNNKSNHYLEHKHKYTNIACRKLSKEAICSISALKALSYHQMYTEAYPRIYRDMLDYDAWEIVFNQLLGFGPTIYRMKQSLERLGQQSLLEAF